MFISILSIALKQGKTNWDHFLSTVDKNKSQQTNVLVEIKTKKSYDYIYSFKKSLQFTLKRRETMKNDMVLCGNRLTLLRNKAGLTQSKFGIELSEYLGMNKAYSQLTISGWENGTRMPPANIIRAIALYYNTTSDYLLGLSDVMYKDEKKTNVTEDNSLTYVIPKEKYSKFDKQPVYVMFEDHLYANRWGILDWPMKRVVFTNKVFKLDSNVKVQQ